MFKANLLCSCFLFILFLSCGDEQKEKELSCAYLESKAFFFVGVPNHFKVMNYSGSPENLRIRYNGKEEKARSNYTFTINVERTGFYTIEVFDINSDHLISSKTMMAKYLPSPTAYLQNGFSTSNTQIRKQSLRQQDGLYCQLFNWDYKMSFSIKEFTIIANINGKQYVRKGIGNKFTTAQKEIIKQLESGHYLIITDIKVEMPMGEIRAITPLVYEVI